MARFVDTFVGARVYNSANISCGNAAWTPLTFDTERYDTDTIHDTGSNTERLTAFTAGKYVITGNVDMGTDGTGDRYIAISINGTIAGAATRIAQAGGFDPQTTGNVLFITTIYNLAVTDFVVLNIFQNSGGPINANKSENFSIEFMMHRIAP